MHDHDESRASVLRNSAEKALEGLYAARGGADRDNHRRIIGAIFTGLSRERRRLPSPHSDQVDPRQSFRRFI